ncbi:MAG: hypothetical protein LBF97_08505 [Elusimicrobiota bacterium]|jgi:predicted XRE-type DNA-binding protein|nr:hypothetical protein [Elusimicrobiota bacterium]
MNLEQLKCKIKKNGLKQKYIAKQLGITPECLIYKLKGKRDFKNSEKNSIIKNS